MNWLVVIIFLVAAVTVFVVGGLKGEIAALRTRLLEEQDRKRELVLLNASLRKSFLFFSSVQIEQPEWSQKDAEAFRRFLHTEHGEKFQQYLRAVEIAQNRHSVRHFPHEPAMCGEARGYGLCISHLIGLSADVRPQQDTPQDAPRLRGEEELREILAP